MPGVDLDAYKHQLIERFSNPEVRDTVARLCAESSDRIPKWLLPVVREQLAAGGEIGASAASSPRWARYAEGVDEQGEPIEVVDRLRDTLVERRTSPARGPAGLRPTATCSATWSTTNGSSRRTAGRWSSLHSKGARATLEALRKGAAA